MRSCGSAAVEERASLVEELGRERGDVHGLSLHSARLDRHRSDMERTHLLKHDLDWLPPGYRAVRWVVAGGLWTALVGGVVGLGIIAHVPVYAFGKGLAVLAAGGAVAGDRAARGVLRGRLRKLARGAVDLSRLPPEPDGELVHVTGRVRALGAESAVYRRVVFSFDGQTRVVRETAQDFWLVGEGEPVLVEVADARLLADGKATTLPSEDPRVLELEALPLPSQLQAHARVSRQAARQGQEARQGARGRDRAARRRRASRSSATSRARSTRRWRRASSATRRFARR